MASREAAAEKRLAEATEAAAEAQVEARQDAEREYMELKASLTQQRMQLEVRPRGTEPFWRACMHACVQHASLPTSAPPDVLRKCLCVPMAMPASVAPGAWVLRRRRLGSIIWHHAGRTHVPAKV